MLVVVTGVFWLFPSLGLAVASLRSSADNSATGWWNVFTAPSQLTLHNYAALLLAPPLFAAVQAAAPGISLDIIPRGTMDLADHLDRTQLPAQTQHSWRPQYRPRRAAVTGPRVTKPSAPGENLR